MGLGASRPPGTRHAALWPHRRARRRHGRFPGRPHGRGDRPDGVGKSSLLAIIAGARQIQTGRVLVLDGDMADSGHRRAVCPRIAYMPQGLGKNLYPDLSVRENIEFFARLFGQSRSEREWRISKFWTARESRHSPIVRPRSFRAACSKTGLCFASAVPRRRIALTGCVRPATGSWSGSPRRARENDRGRRAGCRRRDA